MNVASLELCKELYDLSGWDKTQNVWAIASDGSPPWLRIGVGSSSAWEEKPGYDLGYLLRRLPGMVTVGHTDSLLEDNDESWYALVTYKLQPTNAFANTPENAACKLAIELFKQGILTKQTEGE